VLSIPAVDRRDRVKRAIAEVEHELEAAKRLTQARAAAKKLQRARQELRSFVEAAAKIQGYIRDIPAVTAGVTAFATGPDAKWCLWCSTVPGSVGATYGPATSTRFSARAQAPDEASNIE
jgi:hypothetical protein